jgi:hypothetical protein
MSSLVEVLVAQRDEGGTLNFLEEKIGMNTVFSNFGLDCCTRSKYVLYAKMSSLVEVLVAQVLSVRYGQDGSRTVPVEFMLGSS